MQCEPISYSMILLMDHVNLLGGSSSQSFSLVSYVKRHCVSFHHVMSTNVLKKGSDDVTEAVYANLMLVVRMIVHIRDACLIYP